MRKKSCYSIPGSSSQPVFRSKSCYAWISNPLDEDGELLYLDLLLPLVEDEELLYLDLLLPLVEDEELLYLDLLLPLVEDEEPALVIDGEFAGTAHYHLLLTTEEISFIGR